MLMQPGYFPSHRERRASRESLVEERFHNHVKWGMLERKNRNWMPVEHQFGCITITAADNSTQLLLMPLSRGNTIPMHHFDWNPRVIVFWCLFIVWRRKLGDRYTMLVDQSLCVCLSAPHDIICSVSTLCNMIPPKIPPKMRSHSCSFDSKYIRANRVSVCTGILSQLICGIGSVERGGPAAR